MSRTATRQMLRSQGLQNTQRSWDNYAGDRPIESWVGRAPEGEARFYANSPKWGPGSEDEEEEQPKDKRLGKKDSGLRRAMHLVRLPYDSNLLT